MQSMASKQQNTTIRRRLVSAWISTVISLSMVLLLVGIGALLLINARAVSDYFKEHMQISVLMKPDISDAQTLVEKWRKAGLRAELYVGEGMFHAFEIYQIFPEAKKGLQAVFAFIREMYAR